MPRVLLALLYSVTSFFGAALLFLVQPMVVKEVLPLFGGSPTVWNTATLFFQTALLAGYLATHLLARRLAPRRHALVQVPLALLPLVTLPIGLAQDAEPGGGTPALALLLLLVGAVGAPFLLLSTGGPLLQRWFAATDHPRRHDPYFLFAAGNAGSLLALLGYPLLVEPRLVLDDQLTLWSAGYVVWFGLLVACAVALRRAGEALPVEAGAVAATPPSRGEEVRWVALAALASSLMLGTTTYLTTDIAPVPLLWVVPLSLYLLSFVVAFGVSQPAAARLAARSARLLPLLVVPVVVSPVLGLSLRVLVPLHLVMFTVIATAAHARLSAGRPEVATLTRFYLLIAVGGALGGAVNGLLAPVLLEGMYEFPVALALAVLLVPVTGRVGWLQRRYGALGRVLVLLAVVAAPLLLRTSLDEVALPGLLLLAGLAGLALALRRYPVALAVGVAAALVLPDLTSPALARTRSFFGVQVVRDSGDRHVLSHGTTIHGWQDTRPDKRHLAQSYYEASGPVGQVLAARQAQLQTGRLGVVGLGSGALAAYGSPGQRTTFFEIDGDSERIARDPRLFTYLADSPATVDVVLGDGRLSLREEQPSSFDVLVLDAFSSDAVPLHLLTREALRLYLSRLQPGGVVAFHISNRYLDLAPVLADVVAAEGAAGLHQRHNGDVEAGGLASAWVVVGHDDAALADLARDARWEPLQRLRTERRAWSDDYTDVLRALR